MYHDPMDFCIHRSADCTVERARLKAIDRAGIAISRTSELSPGIAGQTVAGSDLRCRIGFQFPLEEDTICGNVELSLKFSDQLSKGLLLTPCDWFPIQVAYEANATAIL